MKLNWVYLKTKAGKITFCACIADKIKREFEDMNIAYHYEKDSPDLKFQNSIDEFLSDQKRSSEAKMKGEYHESKIEFTDSLSFRALQRRINKEQEDKDQQLELDKSIKW